MNKFLFSLLFINYYLFFSPVLAQDRAQVLLETTAGNIRIELYNETPLHRDNFLKLTKLGVYDSLLFHRVIKNFMIQSGDTNSKHAKPGDRLGTGDFDYTLEPEFRLPQIFHRRGTVAMAREGDDVNPERRSSACQFYIVWGHIHNDASLAKAEARIDSIMKGGVKLTPEMKDVYKTVGGTPHLDGQYTVFGEVIEGLEIVNSIQQTKTDKFNRPLEDFRILKATVVKDIQKEKENDEKREVPTAHRAGQKPRRR